MLPELGRQYGCREEIQIYIRVRKLMVPSFDTLACAVVARKPIEHLERRLGSKLSV
jgi:hypothetical protein